MSNEQKLREALQLCRAALDNLGLAATLRKYAIRTADEALATTEPTGMPELHPVAHIELGDDSHDVVTLEAAKAYGEQCWKAGYKHGAWADKPEPTSKQSLQVEPVVNQQLTTEPLDERGARATLPTQRSSMDGLPKPFGYVSDGFADGLRFQHNPWPVEHTLLHSTMPVFSAAAVQQFKQDAERYRWLADSNNYYEAINLISGIRNP